jgi:ABC-type spermidine/putrescine transport system permease subunit II
MKNTIIGIALLISAVLADIGITISVIILAINSNEWYSNLGKFWTTITVNKLLFPFILPKILFVLAMIILIKEYFDKKQIKTE